MHGLWNNARQVWTNTDWSWIVLWLGLTMLIVSLIVLMRTRWGQSRPLGKCAVLSLVAHLLLAFYATTVEIVNGSTGRSSAEPVRAVLVDSAQWLDDAQSTDPLIEKAALAEDDKPLPSAFDLANTRDNEVELPPSDPATIDRAENQVLPVAELLTAANTDPPEVLEQHQNLLPPAPLEAPTPTTEIASDTVQPHLPDIARLPIETPAATDSATGEATNRTGSNVGLPEPPHDLLIESIPVGESPSLAENARQPAAAAAPPEESTATAQEQYSADAMPQSLLVPVSAHNHATARPVPPIYSDRTAENREATARSRGGSPEAEAAVQMALAWLAANQSTDGRWDADRFGAGKERRVLGQDRGATGAQADTATTGLALLAFLGAGNTHLKGKYKDQVKRGLEHLLNAQGGDGNLGGDAELFAFMYSHGIATLALSEAYAMTADKRLEPALRAAIGYTIAAQHPSTGGWRYRPASQAPQDPGDTSQLGWQLMGLKSAELAGITMPEQTRQGMHRFLRSVSSGVHGGLASYRPHERATRPMTAEALVARQFLGMTSEHPAAKEAGDYLLGDLPTEDPINLYYWYYGTLAMYQLQGEHWDRWNAALQKTLIHRQVASGNLAGSWDPDCIWGGYGGRVYSTAMATLCLEVFYRYLPLYGEPRAEVREARRP